MSNLGYQQFCPVAMAAEILEPRWTMLVLSEMWGGSTRFSEIQRGVPGMSPSLLSRRLREMEAKGLVTRTTTPGGPIDYRTTPLADELEPLVRALGAWAHRNLDPELQLACLDDHLLMWNIRRKIEAGALPRRKVVVQFILKAPGKPDANYWLIVRPGGDTDLCMIDPRFDVDLYVSADLRALTSAWMGHSTFEAEIAAGRIALVGEAALARSMPQWLRRSGFAGPGQGDPRPAAPVTREGPRAVAAGASRGS